MQKNLKSNQDLSNRGFCLFGSGFIITPEKAIELGLGTTAEIEKVISDYRNGKDLTASPRGVMVIDLFGYSANEVRSKFPAVYQHVLENVKPERDQNKRASRKENWWIYLHLHFHYPTIKGLFYAIGGNKTETFDLISTHLFSSFVPPEHHEVGTLWHSTFIYFS